ncbi:MAG: prepilin-type N-terminal cleavage/methylation domain-containing protein [bacterium]|nr:prepilin-type N-terminal cleavage/methylation domain-containing protein [bacterium]
MTNLILKNRGFTLIEMTIYTALFSIMMGGLVVTAYQLIESTSDLGQKVAIQEEMNFISKKIDWALTGVSNINTPTSGISNKLSVDKINFSDNPIVIEFNTTSGDIEFCTNSCSSNTDFTSLTTKNITVNNLTFEYLPANGGSSGGVKVTITINGMINIFNKYLKI